MTKEEAVNVLEFTAFIANGRNVNEIAEAVTMAIDAIREMDSDGCEGCKYMDRDQYEMPCLNCKNSHKNLWTREEA